MEVSRDEFEVHGPHGGSKWFASTGVGKNGQSVTINFLSENEEEVDALAHGLGIAHDVHMHQRAEEIGTAADYHDFTE